MIFGIGGGGNYPNATSAPYDSGQNALTPFKPRTIREQVQDQIAHHTAKVADLQEALDALTPDVEKALNALQKL